MDRQTKRAIDHHVERSEEIYSPVEPPSFVVTVKSVIGRVTLDGSGELDPRAAAFVLIAKSGMLGEFEFPCEDGSGMEVITVEKREHN